MADQEIVYPPAQSQQARRQKAGAGRIADLINLIGPGTRNEATLTIGQRNQDIGGVWSPSIRRQHFETLSVQRVGRMRNAHRRRNRRHGWISRSTSECDRSAAASDDATGQGHTGSAHCTGTVASSGKR